MSFFESVFDFRPRAVRDFLDVGVHFLSNFVNSPSTLPVLLGDIIFSHAAYARFRLLLLVPKICDLRKTLPSTPIRHGLFCRLLTKVDPSDSVGCRAVKDPIRVEKWDCLFRMVFDSVQL